MGLVTKKDTSFRLDESISAFFDMPSLEVEEKNYDELKIDINKSSPGANLFETSSIIVSQNFSKIFYVS